jgi:hypothetical protein
LSQEGATFALTRWSDIFTDLQQTTLALEISKSLGGVYLDLESERDRAKLAQAELYFDDNPGRAVFSSGC